MFTDFLAADVPLVKTFAMKNGELEKSPYPMVRDFTSYRIPTANLAELHQALLKGAENGWCMLKGLLTRQIQNESRAGLTNAADSTWVFMLDLDGLTGYDSIEAALVPLGLHRFQYIVQWSASSHVQGSTRSSLSAHVFFWLANPVNPQLLKSWVMNACLTHFGPAVSLTRSGAALHWPVDPSVMDNSKLIYIAAPILRGLTSSLRGDAIKLVTSRGSMPSIPSSFFNVNPQAVQKAKTDLLNELRKKAGYSVLRDSQFKVSNGQLYLSKPGLAQITGIKPERGFVYINLNGGDSWGYYHPEDNAEYIYNFKGEPIYRTDELLPEYWASLKKIDPQRPQGKTRYFICRDFRTDRLYNGMYHVEDDRLEMARTQNEGRLRSFLKQHGQPVPDFVPDFTIDYNPHGNVKFDLEKRYINTYVPSRFYSLTPRRVLKVPPTIRRIIESAVGTGENFDHFMNWLADLIQFRQKIGTAWVLHGIEGTGKGVLFHLILKPMLGDQNVVSITMRELDSPFNGFLERALLVFVDEVQLPAMRGYLGISASLRNFITEPSLSVRHMYTAPYNAPNFSNFILSSNMPDPVIVPPTDRRFQIGTFQGEKIILTEKDIEQIGKEVEDFFHFLTAYKVDRNRSRTIVESEDRARLMRLSMTAADVMAAAILDGNLEDLVDNMPQRAMLPAQTAYDSLVKDILKAGLQEAILTRDELLTIFDYRVGEIPVSPNKFTSFLKHHRIHTSRVRRNERLFYGINVQWKQSPEWMKQALESLSIPTSGPNVTPIKRAKIA